MKNIVEVDGVSKKFKYQKKDFFAVKDVSFGVEDGEIFGILGPNGAGKTTTLNMIVGILFPDSGSIKVLGNDLRKRRDLMENISMTSGGSQFHGNLKVIDILRFYAKIYGLGREEREKRIGRLIKFFDLEAFSERKFWYLSTGEKMRLTFAKALLNHPKLLLLDEPTLGLDPDIAIRMRDEIKRINKKFGTTIVLTSHYMHEVEQLCDRIAFINKGELVDIGTIEKVKLKQFSSYDVYVRVRSVRNRTALKKKGFTITRNTLHKKMETGENISDILQFLAGQKIKILGIETKKPTLEDYFVKMTGEKNEDV